MERTYNTAITLNIVLVCLGLVCSIITLTHARFLVMSILEVAFYVLICFYAYVGYKKPHGNLLRYLMLAFGLYLTLRIYACSTINETKSMIFYTVSVSFVSYMSGRLNKIKKNKYIAVFVLLILCYCTHTVIVALKTLDPNITFGFVDEISMYLPALMWIALSSAYFTRYLQHKEAGLEG